MHVHEGVANINSSCFYWLAMKFTVYFRELTTYVREVVLTHNAYESRFPVGMLTHLLHNGIYVHRLPSKTSGIPIVTREIVRISEEQIE